MHPHPDPPDPTPLAEEHLEQLLAAYDELLAGGISLPPQQHPSFDHLDPSTRDRLQKDYEILNQLEQIWPRGGSTWTYTEAPGETPVSIPKNFGRFQPRCTLGAGGCGVVFLADDPVLGRPVALKIPRPEVLGSNDLSRRFLREARTAAVLNHPNIIPVYEASSEGGVCYIAAEYCPGPTLSQWLANHPRPTPRETAVLVAALADAMGYAHRRGVVHRDLKPSNVLLFGAGSDGQLTMAPEAGCSLYDVIPKVTDFGFAKLLERTDDATRTGTVIGTPQYMAPEQAEGRLAAIGPATDIYAMGVILYEMLAGHPPIKGTTDADTLRRVVYVDPPRLTHIKPRIPSDLEAVCLKCLEKDPSKRYADGVALAADLWRFLGGESTRARPVNFGERIWKWTARNPVYALLVAVLLLTISGSVYLGIQNNRSLARQNHALQAALQREIDQAVANEKLRILADERATTANSLAYLLQMRNLGPLAMQDRRFALEAAWDAGLDATPEHLRGFEWHYLQKLARSTKTWRHFTSPVDHVVISDDGMIAAACAKENLCIWNTSTGQVLHETNKYAGGADVLKISPDGTSVLILDMRIVDNNSPTLLALDVRTGQHTVLTQHVHHAAPYTTGFLPSGEAYFVEDREDTKNLIDWDPRTQSRTQSHSLDYGLVPTIGLNSNGILAVVEGISGNQHRVVIQNTKLGTSYELPLTSKEPFNYLEISQTGPHVALYLFHSQTIEIWNYETRTLLSEMPRETTEHRSSRFLDDGRYVVNAWNHDDEMEYLTLKIWSPVTNNWSTVSILPECKVNDVVFCKQARHLLIGGKDHSCRYLDLHTQDASLEWSGHSPAETWSLAYSPDQSTLISAGDEDHKGWHPIRVWDPATGKRLRQLNHHKSLVTALTYAPNGKTFASASFDKTIAIWDSTSYQLLRELPFGERVRSLAFSPSGKLIAGGGDGTKVHVWNTQTGELVHTLNVQGRGHSLLFLDDVTLVAGASYSLSWWNLAHGKQLQKLDTSTGDLILTPDRKTLIVATHHGHIEFRDPYTGDVQKRITGPPRRLTSVTMSPDGRTIATGGLDGVVRLWRASTGEELFALTPEGSMVYEVQFSPDGSMLAAAMYDGRILVWTTRDPEE